MVCLMVHERDTPMENNYNVVSNQKYQEIESLYPEALNEFLLNFGEKLLEGDIENNLWFRWGMDRIVIIPIGCMRRFACRNFQITTTVYSKLSYTPCYTQCGLIGLKFDTNHYKKLFKNMGGKFNSEYLYIK